METQMMMILILDTAQTLAGNIEMMKTSGLIEFKQDRWSLETRSWTLYPPQHRTNVVLLIEMIDYRDHTRYETRTLYLPDGISSTVPKNKFLENPFCWVYVKGATTGQVTCEAGVQISNICQKPSVVAQMWPPTISAQFEKFSMLMYYEFIDCQENEVNLIALPTTIGGMESSSKATDTNQTISSETVTETQDRKDSNQSSSQAASSSSASLLDTVIALSVLLFIALVLLAIAAWKNRKLSRNNSTKAVDIAMVDCNNVTEHITSGHESGTKPDVSSIYAMAEEGVGNVSDEKQAVDNELYQILEKQDVINELYDCTS